MIIYSIKNNVNNKMYIGKSKCDRILGHGARAESHLRGQGSQLVRHATKKYGKDNFEVNILYQENENNHDLLSQIEIYYIAYYSTIAPRGYNLTTGGEGVRGRFITKEERLKRSLSKKGKNMLAKLTPDQMLARNKKISESKIGKKMVFKKTPEEMIEVNKRRSEKVRKFTSTPEFRKLASNRQKGKNNLANKTPEEIIEIRKKQSESMKGKNKGKYSCINKSPEEMLQIRKKMSNSGKIAATRPEMKERSIDAGKMSTHERWHIKRNIVNLNCKYCFG